MKNVLVILCDQLRKDTLSCYGNTAMKTPNIDAIAQNGTAFERCYVANPICMPNRLSIFSGMYPRNHGTWTNGLEVEDRGYTLPRHLGEQGYQSANIGKIHFTVTDTKSPDIHTFESGHFWQTPGCYDFHGPYWGFDYVELTTLHSRQRGHYRKWFYEAGGTDELFQREAYLGDTLTGAMRIPERLHCSTYIGERTCDYLRSRREADKPFFLVASFPDPHHAFDPPQETAARYPDDQTMEPIAPDGSDLAGRPAHYAAHFEGRWDRSGTGGTRMPHDPEKAKALAQRRIAYTYAMVDLIDKNVGRILDTLKEQGLLEDTLVVFTSDHGELLGDHGLWKKGPFYYEGLMNVPLIVSGCGVAKGARTQALVSSVDIAPMICTLAGAAPLPFADGISPFDKQGNLIAGRKHCLIEFRVGYGPLDTASFALVEKDFKYVRHQSGEEELTDLANDPQEHVNLTDEAHAPIRTRMALALLDELIATGCKAPRQIAHA